MNKYKERTHLYDLGGISHDYESKFYKSDPNQTLDSTC